MTRKTSFFQPNIRRKLHHPFFIRSLDKIRFIEDETQLKHIVFYLSFLFTILDADRLQQLAGNEQCYQLHFVNYINKLGGLASNKLANIEMEGKMKKVPDDIGKMKIVPLNKSIYLKPFRTEFQMNGKTRYWDFLKVHDSVAVLIYNTSRNVLVVVRQFRPAMYLAQIQGVMEGSEISPTKQDLVKGYSLELCAGLLDKDCPMEQAAKEEVLEECGYDIPTESLVKLFSFRNVGISGQQNTVFYTEVTDEQKVSEGGGIREEGESIEVIEMTIPEIKEYISSCDILSPPSFMAALQWFVAKMKNSEKHEINVHQCSCDREVPHGLDDKV